MSNFSAKQFMLEMQLLAYANEYKRIQTLKVIDKIEKLIINSKVGNSNSDLEIWGLDLDEASHLYNSIIDILRTNQ